MTFCKSDPLYFLAAVLFLAGGGFCQDTLTGVPLSADSAFVGSDMSSKEKTAGKPVFTGPDSSASAQIPASGPLTQPKSSKTEKVVAPPDTISHFFNNPYFGIGFGAGLGSFPIMTDWQSALPDSANAILPINPDTLGFKITEPINSYNILFPIYISYTPFVYRKSSVSFDASFFFIGNSLQATLQKDTFPEKINYKQSLNCYGFTAGAYYRYAIDERYFKIDKVDKTSFILGVSILPFFHLSKNESISTTGIDDSVSDAASGRLRSLSAWGMGGAWRIGMGSQIAVSATSGMDVSVCYVGRYVGSLWQNSSYLQDKDINPTANKPETRLSMLSNTVEIRLEFLFGKRQKSTSK